MSLTDELWFGHLKSIAAAGTLLQNGSDALATKSIQMSSISNEHAPTLMERSFGSRKHKAISGSKHDFHSGRNSPAPRSRLGAFLVPEITETVTSSASKALTALPMQALPRRESG